MTKFLATIMGYALNALYGLFGNYALTIIVFTIIIRLLIMPLFNAQLKSTEQMQEIQPLVNEIRAKYKDKPEVMNEKMQELYSEHKISPAMGCLPLLIQLPIIWGLFALLRNPTLYISDPAMVIAAHEKFLWVQDLAQPDLWILPVVAGAATFISMRITTMMNASAQAADNPANASMKAMQYFMPLMIVWMARTMPSGLTLYWIMSYIFQIFQSKYNQIQRKKRAAKKKQKKNA